MTDGRQKLTNRVLQDYVDGRLPPERRRDVEARLRRDPKAAKVVEIYRRQGRDLARLGAEALHAPVPARLKRALRKHR